MGPKLMRSIFAGIIAIISLVSYTSFSKALRKSAGTVLSIYVIMSWYCCHDYLRKRTRCLRSELISLEVALAMFIFELIALR
jgi:hypothetical protein